MQQFGFDDLINLTEMIQSKTVREKVVKHLKESPAYFRYVPASATGKYHPAYTLGEAGLVRHTAAAVKIGYHICSLDFVKITPYERDLVLASLFLHDTRKKGNGSEPDQEQFEEHAKLASVAVDDGTAAFKRVSRYVLVHMGQWGNNKPANLREFIVHLADYLASRKDLTVSLLPTEEV